MPLSECYFIQQRLNSQSAIYNIIKREESDKKLNFKWNIFISSLYTEVEKCIN